MYYLGSVSARLGMLYDSLRDREGYEAEELVVEAFMSVGSNMGRELKCMTVLGSDTMHADEGSAQQPLKTWLALTADRFCV